MGEMPLLWGTQQQCNNNKGTAAVQAIAHSMEEKISRSAKNFGDLQAEFVRFKEEIREEIRASPNPS